MHDIEIELAGKTFRIAGPSSRTADAISEALARNGAIVVDAAPADLLVVLFPLLPKGDGAPYPPLLADEGSRMVEAGGGRIVFVLSAMAALPVRGQADYSSAMAGALARVRTLAMELAPRVLVNAVGAGVIEDGDALVAGDRHMLGHASLGRAGRIDDIVNTVLFLCDPANTYTTGQILNVDGGWSVGYGRNF